RRVLTPPCSSKILPPPRSPLFPYTTLFRSSSAPLFCTILTRSFTRGDSVSCSSLERISVSFVKSASVSLRHTFITFSSIFWAERSEEHTSELQSRENLVCRLLLENKKRPSW